MIKDILTQNKSLFGDGVHTELRAQVNRKRGVTMLSGNLTGNSRTEVSGVSARGVEGRLLRLFLRSRDIRQRRKIRFAGGDGERRLYGFASPEKFFAAQSGQPRMPHRAVSDKRRGAEKICRFSRRA